MKASLAELEINGPSGPEKEAGPQQYTQVPWEEFRKEQEERKRLEKLHAGSLLTPVKSEYNLSDRTAAVTSE